MPCSHHDIKIVQYSNRQSAVAYQSGERLFFQYDQKQKYYAEKRGSIHTEIMLPSHAPPKYADRNTLWNAAGSIDRPRAFVTRQEMATMGVAILKAVHQR